MRRLIATATIFLCFTVACNTQENGMVYICTGPKATTYHKTQKCRGLNKCSGRILKVTVKQAKEKHRKPCKICY